MSAAKVQSAPFVWDFSLSGKSIETVPSGGLRFRAKASDYSPDRDDEVVLRTALEAGLDRYMRTNPVLLLSHNWERPVGRCTKAWIDDDGLHIEGVLDPAPHPSSWQADVLSKVRSSTLRAVSIGGRFFRERPGVVTKVDLMEISLAAVGKNPNALISEVAGKAFRGEFARPYDPLLDPLRANIELLEANVLAARAERLLRSLPR